MPVPDLYSHLNYKQRDLLSLNGDYQREVGIYIEKHVIGLANQVVEGLRASGQFEPDFEAFDSPDFEQMIENDGTVIIGDGDRPFWFKSDDLSTAELKDDGSCMIDLRGWATDNGINLDEWAFDVHAMTVVSGSACTNPMSCPERDVLAGLVRCEAYNSVEHQGAWSAQDAIDNVLIPILEQTGNQLLAQRLENDPWGVIGLAGENDRHKYVDYSFESDQQSFETATDAMRDACETLDIDVCYRQYFQYIQVSDEFAQALRDEGKVVTEIGELTIWGRESLGLSISMEAYAQRIFAKENPALCDALIRKALPDVAQRIDQEHDAQLASQSVHNSAPTLG